MNKTIIFILFIFSFHCVDAQNLINNSNCKESKQRNYSLGVFAGEGTGLLASIKTSNNFSLEWNIAKNELFCDNSFTNRYKSARFVKFDDIYSTSLLLVYNNTFVKNSKLGYHFGIGSQVRLITNFLLGPSTYCLPPNVFIIWDPTFTNRFDIGINHLIGLDYMFNKNISAFCSVGTYTEIRHFATWTNFQFRFGVKYNFKRKGLL